MAIVSQLRGPYGPPEKKMSNQYDLIAAEYKHMKKRVLYRIVDHSLKNVLKKISGLDVLDLACGEGYTSRQLKSYGANKVIGVDISAEMIKLAQEQERRSPLGIKYICSSAQNLGCVGRFDLVTGIFLLHYANNERELFQICEIISKNLKDDGIFIGANNKGLAKNLFNDFSKYDFRHIADCNIKEGQEFRLIVEYGDAVTEIAMRHYSRRTYSRALRAAGFKKIQWLDFSVPQEILRDPENKKWHGFGKISAESLLICRK